MKLIITLTVLLLSYCCFKSKQININNREPLKRSITYKKIGDTNLQLHYFISQNNKKIKPVIVFFHPGGWFSGDPSFFFQMAKEYSLLGYTTISIQYRLANFKTVSPKNCLEDCIDALKYLNENKNTLHLNMSQLFLIGYSAGGHLALMSQLTNDKQIPVAKKIFTIASPMSLIEDELLKKSTMSTREKIKISPINHIQNLNSDLFLFNGKNDEFINYSTIESFVNKGMTLNKNIRLKTFENGQHFLLTTHQKLIEKKIKSEIFKEQSFSKK